MPRCFRVRDLMVNVGEGSGGVCNIITNCGGVTELCVENTQGCAFTENCNCTIEHAASIPAASAHAMQRSVPMLRWLPFLLALQAARPSDVRFQNAPPHSLCGRTFICTPTFDATLDEGVQVEHLDGAEGGAAHDAAANGGAREGRAEAAKAAGASSRSTRPRRKLSEALEELKATPRAGTAEAVAGRRSVSGSRGGVSCPSARPPASLRHARIRANPGLTLIPFASLSDEERAGFGSLSNDPEQHGVVRDQHGAVKLADPARVRASAGSAPRLSARWTANSPKTNLPWCGWCSTGCLK